MQIVRGHGCSAARLTAHRQTTQGSLRQPTTAAPGVPHALERPLHQTQFLRHRAALRLRSRAGVPRLGGSGRQGALVQRPAGQVDRTSARDGRARRRPRPAHRQVRGRLRIALRGAVLRRGAGEAAGLHLRHVLAGQEDLGFAGQRRSSCSRARAPSWCSPSNTPSSTASRMAAAASAARACSWTIWQWPSTVATSASRRPDPGADFRDRANPRRRPRRPCPRARAFRSPASICSRLRRCACRS